MRQFTTKEQTQHLIELGFPRPCSISGYDYSIGELIEFLGLHLMGIQSYTYCDLPIHHRVQYKKEPNKVGYKEIQGELIDKLYDACVELKNEGEIKLP